MWPVLVGALLTSVLTSPPALPREFRGAWVATVDNIDWPSRPGLPADKQRAELDKLLNRLAALRFNAIVFQVRPSADAVYKSELEPSSWFLTGKQGKDLDFDPLEYVIEQGHELGLEVHAWFNPFRAVHPAQKGPCSEEHVSVSRPELSRSYGKYQWLDPGLPEAREHSYRVFMDVLDRYDLDGIHIDDYFYPYPVGDTEFPDGQAFLRYGHDLSVKDWRRANVDGFIERLYTSIKSKKPWVKFGISPFGIYRPGVPNGIKAGIDQYDDLAADVLKWLQNGWCDYLSPQLYWKIDSTGQPFNKLLHWWTSENSKDRHIWPGLYTSLVTKSWEPSEILNQIRLTRKNGGSSGQVHFSAKAVLGESKNLAASLATKVYDQPAIVPPSPWLGEQKPAKPRLVSRVGSKLSWAPNSNVRFYSIWEKSGPSWRFRRLTSSLDHTATAKADTVSVTPLSRTGIAGASLLVQLAPK